MCTNFTDISGQVFGRLKVLNRNIEGGMSRTYWNCICDCGKYKTVRGDHLKTGKITSCGCFLAETTSKRSTTHGQAKGSYRSTEYVSWRTMKQRCNSLSYHARHRYTGRGIKICERWENSFENFLYDMGKKPTPQHTLDRFPNPDGDYELSNCRWATWEQQQNNKSKIKTPKKLI